MFPSVIRTANMCIECSWIARAIMNMIATCYCCCCRCFVVVVLLLLASIEFRFMHIIVDDKGGLRRKQASYRNQICNVIVIIIHHQGMKYVVKMRMYHKF